MNKEILKQWILALRSGDYKQGRYALCNSYTEFCCLGVLCNISKQGAWNFNKESRDFTYLGEGSVLPKAVREWAGFQDTGLPNKLIVFNDDLNYSFDKIADWLSDNMVGLELERNEQCS